MNKPKLLDKISRDAKVYFGVITTCHFLTVVVHFTTRVRFFVPVSEFIQRVLTFGFAFLAIDTGHTSNVSRPHAIGPNPFSPSFVSHQQGILGVRYSMLARTTEPGS